LNWIEHVKKLLLNKAIFSDIRFWIIVFALFRLYGITNPPLEVAHNWRQTTVDMVARNFYETDANIFYPRIDIAGDKSGITGMEFPIFNYLIYLLSLIFGYEHWYGRLINLVVSSTGIYFFYRIIFKYFKPAIAFNAAFILIVSFWFAYSRKIMPDTFASSLVLISLFYGSNYLDKKSSFRNLALYFIFGLLGILSKLPVAYIWIVYVIWFFNSEIKTSGKLIFTLASIPIIAVVSYWYFIWVPYLIEEFGFWHFFMGDSLEKGITDTITYLPRILNHFYESALRYVAFIFLFIGLGYGIVRKQKLILAIFFLSLLAFTFIIFKSGNTFAFHSYYVLPFIPVMALMAAYGLNQIKNKKVIVVLLFVIGVEGLLNQWNDFRIKPKEKALVALENDFNKISEAGDLIVINSGYHPTPMYFTHRKGWLTSNKNLSDSVYMDDLINRGCKYALILKQSFGSDVDLNQSVIVNNEYYKIYRLD